MLRANFPLLHPSSFKNIITIKVLRNITKYWKYQIFCPSALIIINIIIIICSVHYKKTFIWKTSHDALSKYEYEYKLQGVSKEVANRISRAMLGDQSGLKSIHAKLPKNIFGTPVQSTVSFIYSLYFLKFPKLNFPFHAPVPPQWGNGFQTKKWSFHFPYLSFSAVHSRCAFKH